MSYPNPDSRPQETAGAVDNGVRVAQGSERVCDAQGCAKPVAPNPRAGDRKRFCSDACRMKQWALDHPRRGAKLDKLAQEALTALRPKPGSGIDSIEITVEDGSGVRLTADSTERIPPEGGGMPKQMSLKKLTANERQELDRELYETIGKVEEREKTEKERRSDWKKATDKLRKNVSQIAAKLREDDVTMASAK